MSDKYLPIKIFERRKEYDDRSTEGGGGSKEPKWVMHGESLQTHAEDLRTHIDTLSGAFANWQQEEHELPLVIATTVDENAIAKSYRGNIADMLDAGDDDNVIGLSPDMGIMSVVSSDAVVESLYSAVDNAESNAVLLSSISSVAKFQPYVDSYDEKDGTSYRVRLINYKKAKLNKAAQEAFENYCGGMGIQIESKVRFTKDMYIYRVAVESAIDFEVLEFFEGLYSMEISKPIVIEEDSLSDVIQIPVENPVAGEDYPIVGILDSGVADIPHLTPWKGDNEYSEYPEEYQDNYHGTFVAGIIEYGDKLNGFHTTSLNGVELYDAIVFPKKGIDLHPDDLIDHVRNAIERNPQVKVWSMSLGINVEAQLDAFSPWGMALDNIQDENNVLIIKSAGNCLNFKYGKGNGRINEMADSVRAIVVGSLAHSKGQFDVADIDMPSPFTRFGPGPSSIVKPDLVFYGGNAGPGLNNISVTGVASFSQYGSIVRDVGTSFSTPGVARIAAELAHLVDDDFDPILLRALLIHYAQYPENIALKMDDKVRQMGFGVPVSANDILYNSPDEITLILRDHLEKGSFIEMFDFPFPKSLVDEEGFFRGQITLTLVNKTIIDDKQAGEYCQSNIDVMFGTYETEMERDISKRTVINPVGLSQNKNILSEALYSSKAKGVPRLAGYDTEAVLINYGKKYHPVKKYSVDLADLTPANRNSLLPKDRKWYLKLNGVYRDFLEKTAAKNDDKLSQEFCMVLSIRDPLKIAPVYDEVSQQLMQKNFIHHDIRVRNIVRVENR